MVDIQCVFQAIIQNDRKPEVSRRSQLSRRRFLRESILALLGSLGASRQASAQATGGHLRVISLDNSLTQIALSVGTVPIGISAPSRYRRFAVEPTLPDSVVDVGANVSEPNLEVLRGLKPDLILLNQGIAASSGDMLACVARLAVPSRGFHMADTDPFQASLREHRATCEALDRVREGVNYRNNVAALLDSLRNRTRSLTSRPLLILWSIDRRHSYVLVRNSIFQGVLDRLGIESAWKGAAMPLGMSVIGLEQIALLEDANIAIIESKENISDAVAGPLWQALRPVREGRVALLPPMWTTGGLPVAERFARYLVPALERLEAGHG